MSNVTELHAGTTHETIKFRKSEAGLPPELSLYSLQAILGQIKENLSGLPAEYGADVWRSQQLALIGEQLANDLTDRL